MGSSWRPEENFAQPGYRKGASSSPVGLALLFGFGFGGAVCLVGFWAWVVWAGFWLGWAGWVWVDGSGVVGLWVWVV